MNIIEALVSTTQNNQTTYQSPAQKLFALLQEKGLIDSYGYFKPSSVLLIGNYLETYKSRMNDFFQAKRTLEIRGTDIKIEICWIEILNQLILTNPALFIEVLKQHTLYFIGFDTIEKIFRNWGIDLVAVCGVDYVKRLRAEVETEPRHLFIQYYVSDVNYVDIANLKQWVIDLIQSKFPFPFVREEPKYVAIKESLRTALNEEPDTTFSQWLPNFNNFDLFSSSLTAGHLVLFNNKDPRQKQNNPNASFCLKTIDGQTIEISISPFVPEHQVRNGVDNLRLPLLLPGNPEWLAELVEYQSFILQGVIDFTTGNTTPLNRNFLESSNELSTEDWINSMVESVKGHVSHIPQKKELETELLIAAANKKKSKCPGLSLGVILGCFLEKAMKKMIIEESITQQFTPHCAIALTLSACQSLSSIPAIDLQKVSTTLSKYWKEMKDDESVFFALGYALNKGVPLHLILICLSLAAENFYEKGKNESFQVLAVNHEKSRGKKNDPFLQIAFTLDAHQLYVSIPRNFLKALEKSVLHTEEFEKHHEALALFLQRLFGDKINRSPSPIQHMHCVSETKLIGSLFRKIYSLAKNNFNHTKSLKLFSIYFSFLQRQTDYFSKKILSKLSHLLGSLKKQKNSHAFFSAILTYFASTPNIYLNQACYLVFKEEKNLNLKHGIAKILCKSNVKIGMKVLIHLLNDPRTDLKLTQEIFEILCQTLRNSNKEEFCLLVHSNTEVFDTVLSRPFYFQSSAWLKEQLVAGEFHELATKTQHCIDFETTPFKINSQANEDIDPEAGIRQKLKFNNPDYFYLSKFIFNIQSLTLFRVDSQKAWEKLIIPVLKTMSFGYRRSHSYFLTSCLQLIEMAPPSPEHLKELSQQLISHFRILSDDKTLLRVICEKQTSLFKQMNSASLFNDIIELLDLLINNKITPSVEILPVVANAAEVVLAGDVDQKMVHKIYTNLRHKCFKKHYATLPTEILSRIYLKISVLNSHDFETAYRDYLTHCKYTNRPDQDQLIFLIELCAKENKVDEFAILSKFLANESKEGIRLWVTTFRKIILTEVTGFTENQLLCLKTLLGHGPCISLIKEHELGNPIYDQLKSINTWSPLFVISRYCALLLASNEAIQQEKIVELYQSLPAQQDVIDQAWVAINRIKNLSQNQLEQCVIALLPNLRHIYSRRFFEFLAIFKGQTFFDTNSNLQIKFFEIIFAGLERYWRRDTHNKHYSLIKKLFNHISSKKWTSEDEPSLRKIELYYYNCINYYSHHIKNKPRNENEENINRDIIKFINSLSYLLSLEGWSPSLITSFKKMIRNCSNKKISYEPFSKLLFQYPNHQAGVIVIDQMLKNPTTVHLIEICNILKPLIENSNHLSTEQHEEFTVYCRSILPTLSEHITILADEHVNLPFLQCLSLPMFGQFCEDKIPLVFKVFENIYSSYLKKRKRDFLREELEIFRVLIHFLPEIVARIESEKINRLLALAFNRVQIVLNRIEGFNEFKLIFEEFNEAFPLWKKIESNSQTRFIPASHLPVFTDAIFRSYDLFKNSFAMLAMFYVCSFIEKMETTKSDWTDEWKRRTIIRIAFTFDVILERREQIEELTKMPIPDPEKMDSFIKQSLKTISDRTEKTKLENAFLLYKEDREETKITRVQGNTDRNDIVNLLGELLTEEVSDLTLNLVHKIMIHRLKQLLVNYPSFFSLIKRLNELVQNHHLENKGEILLMISGIYREIDDSAIINWGKDNFEKIYKESRFKNIISFYNQMSAEKENDDATESWLAFYPLFFRIHMNFIMDEPSRLLSLTMAGFEAFESICERGLQLSTNPQQFESRINELILLLSEFKPLSKSYPKERITILIRWLSTAMRMGREKHPENYLSMIENIFNTALRKNLFYASFDEELYRSVQSLLKGLCIDHETNNFEKFALQYVDILMDAIMEKKDYENRAVLMNEWLNEILSIGKEINKGKEAKETAKKVLSYALKQGIYKNFDNYKQKFSEGLKLVG